MLRRISSGVALAAVATLGLVSCREQPVPTDLSSSALSAARMSRSEQADRYLVVFTAERVSSDFGDRVSRLGASVQTSFDGIGVAIVTGLNVSTAAELATGSDIQAVEPDRGMKVHADGGGGGGARGGGKTGGKPTG